MSATRSTPKSPPLPPAVAKVKADLDAQATAITANSAAVAQVVTLVNSLVSVGTVRAADAAALTAAAVGAHRRRRGSDLQHRRSCYVHRLAGGG